MKLENRIIYWLKGKIKEAGAKGIVLGISGGVDSAVVAVLSRQAAGRNTLGLIIPCYSDPADLRDARNLAGKFDIRARTIDIAPVYDRFLKILPGSDRVAKGNLKARLRMITLYYFANKMNYLVAGTGNKSELSVGYFTKYGDGGVDILPLAGLLKTEVWKLAEQLGVPRKIIEKKPTGGLWKGQTDEGEMGILYRDLDEIIRRIEKGGKVGGNKASRVRKLMSSAKHKQELPPKFKQ